MNSETDRHSAIRKRKESRGENSLGIVALKSKKICVHLNKEKRK